MTLSFPETLYVGLKCHAEFDITNPQLGFATPGGTDAAATKRKTTVDDWCKSGCYVYDPVTKKNVNKLGDNPPVTIPNVLMTGFEFDRSVSRYSTSNKWFQVTDPRGFQLQISSENMADILLNSEISKGLIVGNFIWGRSGSNNYLTREDHPDYIAAVTKKVERAIRPGDIVKSSNETLLYIGPVFTYNLSYEDSDKSTQYSYYHRDEKRKHVFSTRAVTATSHLFMPCNEKGVVGRAVDYHGLANYSTKTDIKKLVIVGEIDPPEFPADGTTVSGMDYRGFKKLFQTKAALKAFSMTDDEVYAFYRGLKHPDKINPVSRKHT